MLRSILANNQHKRTISNPKATLTNPPGYKTGSRTHQNDAGPGRETSKQTSQSSKQIRPSRLSSRAKMIVTRKRTEPTRIQESRSPTLRNADRFRNRLYLYRGIGWGIGSIDRAKFEGSFGDSLGAAALRGGLYRPATVGTADTGGDPVASADTWRSVEAVRGRQVATRVDESRTRLPFRGWQPLPPLLDVSIYRKYGLKYIN